MDTKTICQSIALQTSTTFIRTVLALLPLSNTSLAGEPPFPAEMLYPNVIPPVAQFGTFGIAQGEYSDPRSACFFDKKTLLIADSGNRRLQLVSADGKALGLFGEAGAKALWTSPIGVACNDTFVVVTDSGANEVVLMDRTGKILRRIGKFGNQPGEFIEPAGVCLFAEKIYVADTVNSRVQVFNLEGALLFTAGRPGSEAGELNHPLSVSVDSEENIFVTDSWNNRIQKFSPQGEFLLTWGEWGSHAGFFATPSSVVVVKDHVYVTDLTNHRVQVFDRQGHFLFQWGRHPINGHDGNGRTHYPWSLAVDQEEEQFALVEPIENRLQVFAKIGAGPAKNVNDSAWWDKATRFHYGSRVETRGSLLAVSEPDTHSVLVFDITGEVPQLITRLGGRGTALGKLIEPSGMAIDEKSGRISVTDAGNLRVQTFQLEKKPAGLLGLETVSSPAGFLTDLGRTVNSRTTALRGLGKDGTSDYNREKAGKFADIQTARPVAARLSADESLIYPGAMKQAPNGFIFLYDQQAAKIVILDGERVVKSFGGYGSGPGQFRSVHNMSFSKDGSKLFVVDSYNFRVQIFTVEGEYLSSFGKPGHLDDEFQSLFGITSGQDGFIYLTDETKHCIYKYSEEGIFVARWSRWGTEPGELYKPKGICQDQKGRLLLMSFGNHRGEIFDTNGKHLGSFGLADPETQRGKDVRDLLLSRPVYSLSAKTLFDKDTSSLLNSPRANRISDTLFNIVSNNGGYKVRVDSNTPMASVTETQTWQVQLTKGDGSPTGDVSVEVDATMPQHAHGMSSRPQIKKLGPGRFEVGNMRLSMQGMWEVYFDIGDHLETERAQMAIFAD